LRSWEYERRKGNNKKINENGKRERESVWRKLLRIATDICKSDISVHIKSLGTDVVRGFHMSWS